MKYSIVIILAMLCLACNQPDSKKQGPETGMQPADTTTNKRVIEKDSLVDGNRDTFLLQLSAQILGTLKAKDYRKLSFFVHPRYGVRFSAYGYIDTTNSLVLSAKQLASQGEEQSFTWGSFDGTGKPIKMNTGKYFDRFVYDKDFLHAEKKSVNKFLGFGNSLNNLKEVYPRADFTEFYFSGFDPQYEGMDWRTLRLVFQTENKQPYLIAIVHDEWTS